MFFHVVSCASGNILARRVVVASRDKVAILALMHRHLKLLHLTDQLREGLACRLGIFVMLENCR